MTDRPFSETTSLVTGPTGDGFACCSVLRFFCIMRLTLPARRTTGPKLALLVMIGGPPGVPMSLLWFAAAAFELEIL